MSDSELKLLHPPIVEAVLDIDCDIKPDFELSNVELSARKAYEQTYPLFRFRQFREHLIEQSIGAGPKLTVKEGLQAYQFLTSDEKQLVQLRVHGFSFNRLAPYAGLDSYLSEIERTWNIFVGIVQPIQIRAIRLRFINRLLLPFENEKVDLDHYIRLGPRLPDEDGMALVDFMARNVAIDRATRSRVTVSMASQPSEEGKLPIVLDIEVGDEKKSFPDDWLSILNRVKILRALKNQVFKRTLEEKCLALFQQ